MGDVFVKPGGGGADSEELTASKDDVLKGMTAVTHDSDGEPVAGTLELTGNITAADIRAGKTGYSTNPKSKITGTQEDRGAWNGSVAMNGSVAVPAGIHSGGGKVTGPAVTQRGAWTGSVGMNGSVTVPEGYHNGAGKVTGPAVTQRGAWTGRIGINGKAVIPAGYHNGSGYVDQALTTMGAQTITPSVSTQTVSCSGKYMTGNVTIGGDADLVASNIRKSKNIFGVTGTMEDYSYLAQDQVAFNGTSFSGVLRDGLGGERLEAPASWRFGGPGTTTTSASVNTKMSINLTPFSQIKVKAHGDIKSGKPWQFSMGLFVLDASKKSVIGRSVFDVPWGESGSNNDMTLDVSGLSGHHFLKFTGNCRSGGEVTQLYIDWIEFLTT